MKKIENPFSKQVRFFRDLTIYLSLGFILVFVFLDVYFNAPQLNYKLIFGKAYIMYMITSTFLLILFAGLFMSLGIYIYLWMTKRATDTQLKELTEQLPSSINLEEVLQHGLAQEKEEEE